MDGGEPTDVEDDSDDDMYHEHKENVNSKAVHTPLEATPNRTPSRGSNVSAPDSQCGDEHRMDNTPCSSPDPQSPLGRLAIFTIGDVDQMRSGSDEEEEELMEGHETIGVDPAMYDGGYEY